MNIERNHIYLMDCLEGMPHIADCSVDMILADLPYGTTQNKWDVIIPFDKLWEQYRRIIKPNGAIVLTACQPFTSMLVMSNINWFKYEWIWDKKRPTNHLNAKKQPLRQHESILVFYKQQPTYNPQMHKNKLKRDFVGKCQNPGTANYGKQRAYISQVRDDISYPRSIIEQTTVIGNSKEKRGHSTQKPVALFETLIKTYTNPGELVLDNTIGSGTTAEACINTGRDYIGFEIDQLEYQDCLKRVLSILSR